MLNKRTLFLTLSLLLPITSIVLYITTQYVLYYILGDHIFLGTTTVYPNFADEPLAYLLPIGVNLLLNCLVLRWILKRIKFQEWEKNLTYITAILLPLGTTLITILILPIGLIYFAVSLFNFIRNIIYES